MVVFVAALATFIGLKPVILVTGVLLVVNVLQFGRRLWIAAGEDAND